MIYTFLFFFFAGCSSSNQLTRTPQEDKIVFETIKKLDKSSKDVTLQKEFESVYADAVLNHQRKITDYKTSDAEDKWERIMAEYGLLNKLSEGVLASTSASNLVKAQRYDELYAEAKQKAADNYYESAQNLLTYNNRDAAKDAYDLLQRLDKIYPNYKNSRSLLNEAYNKSILNVVVIPVNYYAQSYGYWGLQNDYVQQEIVRDLRFQLGSANVKVFTQLEARSQRINPDKIIELRWDQLFMPQPFTQTFTRAASKQIEVGRTKDNQPIYNTVNATLYITRRELRASGNLICRVSTNSGEQILSEYFPSNYNYVQEFATYRGDSRALSGYDLALINNTRMNNYSRRDVFTEVFRQVYPQLISRLRSINW